MRKRSRLKGKGKGKGVITERDILSLAEEIGKRYSPEKVILFGSYAYGVPAPFSDLDLLVVMEFEGKTFRKSLEILNSINPHFAVDLLVRRPDDVARRYQEGDPLIGDALNRGRVVYERGH